MSKSYSSTIRSELGLHPVWEPGSNIAPGDFGQIQEGTFQKLGNVRRFVDANTIETENSRAGKLKFSSKGTSTLVIGSDGKTHESMNSISEATASIKLHFSREHSVYLSTSDTTISMISNLHHLSEKLRENEDWDFGWVFVSSVRSAKAFSLILSGAKDSDIFISGKVDVLSGLVNGSLANSSGLSFTGEAAYKLLGTPGPVSIELVRLRWLLGGVAKAVGIGTPLGLKPYEYVPLDFDDNSP